MKLLWISARPAAVEQRASGDTAISSTPAVSWILGHLPPPPDIELHIAVLWPGAQEYKEIEYNGARFHLLPCPRRGRALLFFLRDTALFRPLFERLRPDIVHGWGTEDSFGLVARRLAPERHVIEIQGLITEYRKRVAMPMRTLLTEITERWTLQRARCVVAESNYSLRAAKPLCPRACMFEVEHPLREEFLTHQVADGYAKRVLFVGSLDNRKGIGDALVAFASATEKEWSLQVVSSGCRDAEAPLQEKANALGVKDRVVFHHNLAPRELAAVMQESSVFLLPTRIDTGPTALKEALAMGLWPVCYDNSGPGEYIRELRFGSLAADLDLGDLKRQLSEALRTRPWLDPKLRLSVLRHTRERFSKQEIWAKLKDVYGEVMKGSYDN